MNPSGNNSGMELPPVIEQLPSQANESGNLITPEKKTGRTSEKQPGDSSQSVSVAPSIVSLPQTNAVNATRTNDDNSVMGSVSSAAAQFAQDKDLIDKEWVNKAKSIVERNKDDPYKQSEELTLLKADYMKKRFNKTLKLNK